MINEKVKNLTPKNNGAALLVVLAIVMTVTILSLGFLSRADVELACGQNMILRMQMDYLAESALEHAKGLILNPQSVDTEYWTGDLAQQLIAAGSDYYDVNVVKLGELDYEIACNAYRLNSSEKLAGSSLNADLRLDPAIAFWSGTTWNSELQTTVNGDVYCNGILKGQATVNGDAFANFGITDLYVQGRKNQYVTQPPVAWPGLNVADFSSNYYIGSANYSVDVIDSNISSATFEPTPLNPAGVCYCYEPNNQASLAGNVNINGMLVVNGDLTVTGTNNVIIAVKNFPALLVSGQLIIQNGASLQVTGLAQIGLRINVAGAVENADIDFTGALFIANGNIDNLNSSALTNSVTITAAPAIASIQTWPAPGTPKRWSPAAAAFFRSIRRQ